MRGGERESGDSEKESKREGVRENQWSTDMGERQQEQQILSLSINCDFFASGFH